MPKHLYEDEAMAQEVFQEEADEADGYFAKQYEQELNDEDLARQLARAEERALAAEERARGRPPARPWTLKRVCSFFVPLVIIVIGVVALVYAVQHDSTITPPVVVGVPFFEDQEDPWEGLSPNDVVRWNNGGSGGLHLEVVDALQSHWEEIFHLVVKDYDEGTPKALSLSTEKQGYDAECEPLDNKSKVCNADYGDTQWRGINQVLIQNGYIVATTSKMNEFYLAKATSAQKRYTLCHEMGHSFGLPHSDENFFNPDKGNCMDYTTNPEQNMSPDESSFTFLQDLYGTLPGGSLRALERTPPDMHRTIPDEIRTKLKEIIPPFENRLVHGASKVPMPNGWRLLRRSNSVEAHAMSLGNGWSVQVNRLLVLKDDEWIR